MLEWCEWGDVGTTDFVFSYRYVDSFGASDFLSVTKRNIENGQIEVV